INIKAKGQHDDDEIGLAIEDLDESLKKADKEKQVYGPSLPGEYNVTATVKNDLGTFHKAEKKDLWGDADVSFLIDDEKLARDNEEVQKNIINAVNTFNADMSVYITSGYEADKFTNGTKNLKNNL